MGFQHGKIYHILILASTGTLKMCPSSAKNDVTPKHKNEQKF